MSSHTPPRPPAPSEPGEDGPTGERTDGDAPAGEAGAKRDDLNATVTLSGEALAALLEEVKRARTDGEGSKGGGQGP